MPNRFPIYSRLLMLYPKTYRREYGQQITQTLEDMIDDEPSKLGRLYIWAQISFDFPFSVIQQNITAKRRNAVQKFIPKLSKRTFIGLLIVAIVVAGVGVYEFGRSKLVPLAAKVVYGKSMRSQYEANKSALGDPSQLLIGQPKNADTICNSTYESVRVHVSCEVVMQSYGALAQGEDGKRKTIEAANKLEENLKKSGYAAGFEGNTNGVTVAGLVSGTYDGVDYSPDAFYTKKVGASKCTFQVTVAYSNPKPPAVNILHACIREFDPFGVPQFIKDSRQAIQVNQPLGAVTFDESGTFTEEEKKIIRERVVDPKLFYELSILKRTDLSSIKITKGNPGYVMTSEYGKESVTAGVLFGTTGTIEFWTPQLCDPGGCREYPVDFRTAYPATFAAYTACQAISKDFDVTAKCIQG